MKKLVLFVMAVMAFAGMSVAQQDVWSVGYYTDANNRKQVGVFKNNAMQYHSTFNEGYYGESAALAMYNGVAYWIMNSYKSDGTLNGFYLGKGGNNTYLNASGTGTHAYDVVKTESSYTWVVGCKNSSSGVKTAYFWREDSDNSDFSTGFQDGNGTYPSEAFGVTYKNGLVRCGYQYTSSTAYHGVIWYNGQGHEFANLGDNIKAYDIVYYNGYFYTVGTYKDGSTLKAKVWRTNIDTGTTYDVYTLQTGVAEDQQRLKIYIDDAGDIYNVVGYGTERIYKNGQEITNYNSTIYYYTSVVANTNGIYYAGGTGSAGKIWKNGSVLYSRSAAWGNIRQ